MEEKVPVKTRQRKQKPVHRLGWEDVLEVLECRRREALE